MIDTTINLLVNRMECTNLSGTTLTLRLAVKSDNSSQAILFRDSEKLDATIKLSLTLPTVRIPKLMNKLQDLEDLEIRTHNMDWLKKIHFQLTFSHAWSMAGGWGEKLENVLMWTIDLFGSQKLMDEYYLNGELVAFATSVVANQSYIAQSWVATAAARKKALYFEAGRLELKRAIADPHVQYYRMSTNDIESVQRAKLDICCFQLKCR